ncbi:MAG: hypothetical protein KKE71_00860 [Nanoarchaeota archaeon]|nr:hypothetical protein [Nanoarchaeota archaeon]
MVLAIILTTPTYAANNIDCSFSYSTTNPDCPGPQILLFKGISDANSHAGVNTSDISEYPWKVCCKLTGGGNLRVMNYSYANRGSCTSPTMGGVISISRNDNAHVADYGQGLNYQNNLCLSSTSGNISCVYQNGGGSTCTGSGYKCIASITDDINAHVGKCGRHDRKICCKFSQGYLPPLAGDLDMGVGETGMFVFNITNTLSDSDIYTIDLSGSPSKIGYWSWFNGHRYDDEKNNMSVTLKPGETAAFAVLVFGGEVGSGTISVNIKSASTGETRQLTKSVVIRFANDGIFTDVPEFGWLWYIIIGIVAAIILI